MEPLHEDHAAWRDATIGIREHGSRPEDQRQLIARAATRFSGEALGRYRASDARAIPMSDSARARRCSVVRTARLDAKRGAARGAPLRRWRRLGAGRRRAPDGTAAVVRGRGSPCRHRRQRALKAVLEDCADEPVPERPAPSEAAAAGLDPPRSCAATARRTRGGNSPPAGIRAPTPRAGSGRASRASLRSRPVREAGRTRAESDGRERRRVAPPARHGRSRAARHARPWGGSKGATRRSTARRRASSSERANGFTT